MPSPVDSLSISDVGMFDVYVGNADEHYDGVGTGPYLEEIEETDFMKQAGLIFLGGEDEQEPEGETPFWRALENVADLDPVDKMSDETITHLTSMWLTDEQRRLAERMASFTKRQQRILEEHCEQVEHEFHLQRTQMRSALTEARNTIMSSSDSFSVDTIPAVDRGIRRPTEDFVAGSPRPCLDDPARSRTLPRHSKVVLIEPDWADVSAGPFRASAASGPDRNSQRSNHSLLSGGSGFNTREERMLRIRLAYETAAQRFQAPTQAKWRQSASTLIKTNAPRPYRCSSIERFVDSDRFRISVALIICLNAVFIGITSNFAVKRSVDAYDAQGTEVGGEEYADLLRPVWEDVLDYAFNVFFVVELLLRLLSMNMSFCLGKEWKWNIFDAIVVAITIPEMWLRTVGFSPTVMRALRVVKIFRSLRFLRLLRFSHHIPKLRAMTLAIVNCSMMLLWAVVVLTILVFLFSIVFMNATAQYISDARPGDEYVEDMKVFFGSLFMTMLSLFMVVSGGVDWWDIAKILLEIHVGYALIFLGFIIITVLAVLNVISAVFVNDALEGARKDYSLRTQAELEDTAFMVERLTAIFQEVENGAGSMVSGVISQRHFVLQMEREDVKMQLALLGFYFSDGLNFFKLLDVDRNGHLAIEEFVMGCLRLKGGALLIDTNVLVQETRKQIQAMANENKRFLEDIVSDIKEFCSKFEADSDEQTIETWGVPGSDHVYTTAGKVGG